MRKLKAQARKLNLLAALELLDEAVRKSPIVGSYLGSLTEQAVQEAIRRARRPRSKGIRPRQDQMVIEQMLV